MTPAVEVVLKTSLLVAAVLAAVSMPNRLCSATRHWLIAAAIVLAGLMPVLDAVVPGWQIPLVSSFVQESSSERTVPGNGPSDVASPTPAVRSAAAPRSTATPAEQPRSMTLGTVLALVWAAGAILCLSTLGVALVRLRYMARTAAPIESGAWRDVCDAIARERGLGRRISLLAGNRDGLLVTWGTIRPKVMLPATAMMWPADRVSAVLSHELAHIERGDWLVQLAGELLRSVYWFNPLVWLACRQLRRESELACDDVVLRGGMDPADYAAHLVELARQMTVTRAPWLPRLPLSVRHLKRGLSPC